MDCLKVGKLIHRLRNEKGYMQKQLAEAMNISDKTISKWERGLGLSRCFLTSCFIRSFGCEYQNWNRLLKKVYN